MRVVPKDVIEKQFILDFFKELPISELKRLINYQEINPNNEELWNKSPEMNELLHQLRWENVTLLKGEIFLEGNPDDIVSG